MKLEAAIEIGSTGIRLVVAEEEKQLSVDNLSFSFEKLPVILKSFFQI